MNQLTLNRVRRSIYYQMKIRDMHTANLADSDVNHSHECKRCGETFPHHGEKENCKLTVYICRGCL